MIHFNVTPDFKTQCEIIEQIIRRYPCVHQSVIGKSLCGRNIHSLKIGLGNPCYLICAGFHGTEYLTVLAALKFACDAAEMCQSGKLSSVIIVPCVNPDGTEIAVNGFASAGTYSRCAKHICKDKDLWKANARGVDINHNFDACWQQVRKREISLGITGPACTRFGGCSPESEPETQAITSLCNRISFKRVLALHSQGREIYWDFGSHTPKQCLALANRFASVSGYKVASPEPIATGGGFKDWFIQRFHRCGFTVEMGLGENPLPLSDFETEYPLVKAILTEFVSD